VGQTKADILRGGWVGSDMGCRSKVPPVQRNGTQRRGPPRDADGRCRLGDGVVSARLAGTDLHAASFKVLQ
jgi:hypothetical protein